jgi:phospholipase A2
MSALLATLPKGTFMSRILFALNKFIRLKRWERLWANPIRAGHEPNPFYGLGLLPSANRPKREREETGAHDEITQKSNLIHPGGKFHEAENEHSWESQGRVRLMDGGMSNNLPNHILSRPERCADMLIAFDASSDVQASSAIQRIQNFADDCEITLYDESMEFEHATPRHQPTGDGGEEASAYQTESKYLRHYARVFRGNRKTGENIYLVYCPLLPNAVNPHFNPSVIYSLDSSSKTVY